MPTHRTGLAHNVANLLLIFWDLFVPSRGPATGHRHTARTFAINRRVRSPAPATMAVCTQTGTRRTRLRACVTAPESELDRPGRRLVQMCARLRLRPSA